MSKARVPECVPQSVIDRCKLDLSSLPRFEASAAHAHAQRASAADAPPLLTGGEIPNLWNTERHASQVLDYVELEIGGKKEKVPVRRPQGKGSAFVDWVSFTFHDSAAERWGKGCMFLTHDDVIKLLSVELAGIFGFGITSKRDRGINFYANSWVIGDGWGFVGYGGQKETVLVQVSGEGLAAALDGWERRLFQFLVKHKSESAHLTRVDLAHDDFDGVRSVDRMFKQFLRGRFTIRRRPEVEQVGNWIFPNGRGRTLYIGRRKSGKFARIYEKGRQLGDRQSPWVRLEVEFKNEDRHLPAEMLLQPGEFLAGAYPAFRFLNEVATRIETGERQAKKVYENTCKWVKKSVGKVIAFLTEMEGSAEAFVQKYANPEGVEESYFKKFDIPRLRHSVPGIHEEWQVTVAACVT